MQSPIERLQQELDSQNIDVAFVLKPHDVFYLSSYASVCSGVLMTSEQEPVFCTLWLDAPEAREKCALSRVGTYVFPEQSLVGRMIKMVRKQGGLEPKRIGIEKDFMVARQYEMLTSEFPQAELVHITPVIDGLRAIKTPQELEHIKAAAAMADQAMEAALAAVAPGVSELEVAAEAEYVMRKAGSLRTAFSTFVASGERTLLAHPIASPKIMQPGEAVVIDLGAVVAGYSSDLCRTTFVGEPTPEQRDRLRLVFKAQESAAAAIKPGALAKEVYAAAREVFASQGLERLLPSDLGYGVGLRQSEFHPVIERHSGTELKENMVIALMQTTAYDRSVGGLRVEDTYWVSPEGAVRLTKHRQDLY
ncbi:MAG: Xaa-Pro peptidase family protein [Deltaproteobacteria bacterium]|nr:Xaa-Pro peptidase family protein [Deltaproteobacteria bacterium]